jgi:hypothetical protein
MAKPKDLGFLPDGRERALEANEGRIKAIEAQIQGELQQEIQKIPPVDGLY